MGQIIKQPDGLYAIWSGIVDDFIWRNLTPAQVIEAFVSDYRDRIIPDINDKLQALESGGKPYHQFTMTWEEALEVRNMNGRKGPLPKTDAPPQEQLHSGDSLEGQRSEGEDVYSGVGGEVTGGR